MRCQAIKVTIRDRDHVSARNSLAFRNHALGGRMCRQIVRIVKRGIGLGAGAYSDSWIAFARQVPFRLTDLPVVDFEPHRHHRGAALFFEGPKISRLLTLGVEIPALHFTQRLRTHPYSGAWPPDHGILGLPEPHAKRRSRRIVLHNRVEILIEHALQTSPIAPRAISAPKREESKKEENVALRYCIATRAASRQ